jgi:hypothetical protein
VFVSSYLQGKFKSTKANCAYALMAHAVFSSARQAERRLYSEHANWNEGPCEAPPLLGSYLACYMQC